MTWFWGAGAWWAWTSTGWQICFSVGPVAMASFGQLACPPPRLDLSDEALAAFIDATSNDAELWGRS